MTESDQPAGAPTQAPKEPKRGWSTESVTIVGTGAAIVGLVVALFIAMLSGFSSISARIDTLNTYREDRLEIVRQEQRTLIRDLQDRIDDSVGELDGRIRAIEVDQAQIQSSLAEQ